MNSLTVKQRSKLTAVQRAILKRCPELDGVDVDADSRPNTKGRNVGFELRFTLYSSMIPELNNEEIVVTSTKAMNTVTADWMVGAFELSYKEFCEDCGISRSFRPDVAMEGYVWGNNVVQVENITKLLTVSLGLDKLKFWAYNMYIIKKEDNIKNIEDIENFN